MDTLEFAKLVYQSLDPIYQLAILFLLGGMFAPVAVVVANSVFGGLARD